MSVNSNTVCVIGAGVGGMAVAIRLAVKGYSVSVYESNSYVGGKLSQIESDNFRFDAGPSLFTMPELVDELFQIANKNPRDYFNYQELEESCRYFYEDGTNIIGYTDPEKFAQESEAKTGVDAKDVIKHLKKSEFIYDSTAFLFLQKSLHRVKTYLSLKVVKSFLKLPFLGIFKSMHSANQAALSNDKMVQLFNRYATYNGSNPYIAPAILNIIPHLEFNKGAYFPNKGMYSISLALYNLALSLGVKFNFNSKVEEIIVNDKKVKGIVCNGDTIFSDFVVSNLDVFFVYKNLLKNQPFSRKIATQERSTSALIFYWGINATFPSLDLHNIFFSKEYKKEFQELKNGSSIYNDPTVYVNITSKKNTVDAPKNCENWFVMINVPSLDEQDWDSLINEAKASIIKKLNRMLNTDLESLILTEHVLDPRGIELKTGSYKGSLYGTASNKKMAAFFRHPNFSSDIGGLYFCGGSVHPGGGIPLALSSAKIVDELFQNLT